MSPYLRGRIDIDKYVKGAQIMDNFLPTIQGAASYREGFRWVAQAAIGNVQLIEFTINDENRYLLVLSACLLVIYDAGTQERLFVQGTGLPGSVVPYSDEEVLDVRFTKEVEEMLFTHRSYEPRSLNANLSFSAAQLLAEDDTPLAAEDDALLFSGSSAAAGQEPWDFSVIEFTSHPFRALDTTGNIMRIDPAKEVVRLESTNATDYLYTPTELGNMHLPATAQYVEYKVANQWGLARVLTTTENDEGVTAPEDPTGLTCYVDPVSTVVNVEDPAVRLFMIAGTADTWTEEDRVPDGDFHVRADSLIFNTANVNGWIRVGGSKLFTNVCQPTSAPDTDNSQDGLVRWGKITELLGVEDHPVDFVYDTTVDTEFDSGLVYQVYEWSDRTELAVFNLTGTADADRTALCVSDGQGRFAMDYHIVATGGTDTDMVIANMSTQRQFDVVEVDKDEIRTEGTLFRSPAGTVSLFDLITDETEQASHSTTLYASRLTFESPRDIGRFVLGQLEDAWVLLKITSVTNENIAIVDVLNSIPEDNLTGDPVNDGVFTEFRLGAWYEDNWPTSVSFYEQRRVFAGTTADPNLVWLSKTNDSYDFRTVEDDGLVLDTTGITYPLGTSSTIIRWLEAGPTLIAGTEANEWQLRPNEFSAAITPENIRITQETALGSTLQGKRQGSSVFFPRIGGKVFMEFKYDFQTQQFVTTTATKLVNTLFESDPIISFSYQNHPHSAFWVVTASGRLVTLTYRKEDDYYAWSEHPHEGTCRAVVAIPKGDQVNDEDQLWAVYDRSGESSLELLANAFVDDGSDNLKSNLSFLDAHVRYPATGYEAQTSVPSPSRFGDEVATVVDGVYLGVLPVVAGLVQLPESVEVTAYAIIGFGYTGYLQGMPQAWSVSDGNAYGRDKKLINLKCYLFKSLGYDLGFDKEGSEDTWELVRTENALYTPMGESPELYTGFTDETVPLGAQFGVDEVPIIRQSEPYPLNIVSTVIQSEL